MADEKIMGTEKEFLDVFKDLSNARNTWEVWDDMLTAIACSISNSLDKTSKHYDKRESEYMRISEKYNGPKLIAKIFTIITLALDRNPDQDFLGKIYMQLGLGSHWKGQFFTPYSVCKAMAEMQVNNTPFDTEKDYISINDPACGAGATLIAMANVMRSMKINYQEKALFIGQDLDRVVAMMCYIQLSILGCPGYVAIADTLTNPLTGSVLMPNESENQDIWFTPFYFTNVWSERRALRKLGINKDVCGREEKVESETKIRFYFDFEKKEALYVGKRDYQYRSS